MRANPGGCEPQVFLFFAAFLLCKRADFPSLVSGAQGRGGLFLHICKLNSACWSDFKCRPALAALSPGSSLARSLALFFYSNYYSGLQSDATTRRAANARQGSQLSTPGAADPAIPGQLAATSKKAAMQGGLGMDKDQARASWLHPGCHSHPSRAPSGNEGARILGRQSPESPA